jgi:transmembrane sensor
VTEQSSRQFETNHSNRDNILQEAAEWFALIQSKSVSPHEREDWQNWLSSSIQHRQAWQKVERISGRFNGLPVSASRVALDASAQPQMARRQALKTLSFAVISSVVVWQVIRHQHWNAQYSTAHGETRQLTLEDGTLLWLNTASAVDIVYTADLRKIVLLKGELYIETAPDNAVNKRPLVVDTKVARLQALGTKFGVREYDSNMRLSVSEGAVEIRLKKFSAGALKHRVMEAGQQAYFDEDAIDVISQRQSSLWMKGTILADNMRLDDFISELNRYYRGHLSVNSRVAALRIVGAYPFDDIERILSALEKSLPVTVRRTLPWWINIGVLEG